MFGNKSRSMALIIGLASWPACGADVTVSVYDFAHVGPKTLKQAEQLVADVFVSAGIVARLTTAISANGRVLGSDFSAPSVGGCTQSPLPVIVRAQILPHAPPGFTPHALGYSLPCAQRGTQITVYADRMEAVSRAGYAAFYQVLAHSLAHELGHVLLRSNAHEASGLMKGFWTKNDWQRAAVFVVRFSSQRPHSDPYASRLPP
jgi:hypothetical protein